MFTTDLLGAAGVVGGGFGVAVLTALVPWLNAEILLMAALPTAHALEIGRAHV